MDNGVSRILSFMIYISLATPMQLRERERASETAQGLVLTLVGWSWVFLFSLQMTLLPMAAMSSSVASGVTLAQRGCKDRCGNLTIPYPFGIGPAGCYRAAEFQVACVDGRTYLQQGSSNIVIAGINLLEAQLRIYFPLIWMCYGQTGFNGSQFYRSTASLRLFTTSTKKNRITAVGCNTLATVERFDGLYIAATGCLSICQDRQSVDNTGHCSGMGCCQIDLPPNLFTDYIPRLDARFNNSMVADFNPCGYSFIVEKGRYKFNASDLEGDNMKIKYKDGFPGVLDWVVGLKACDKAMMNGTSYACCSRNSQCINSPNVRAGYHCNCSDGYTGNPYLEEGCLDIDECKFPDQYPCHGICSNTQGGYNCSCSPGTHSEDPKCKP